METLNKTKPTVFKWHEQESEIVETRKLLKDDLGSCDVTFVTKGGLRVPAHRLVLVTCSDKLRFLLDDIPDHGQDALIFVPDVEADMIEAILAFVYLGESVLVGKFLSDFVSTLQLLGINAGMVIEQSSLLSGVAPVTGMTAALEPRIETQLASVQHVGQYIGASTQVQGHLTLHEQPNNPSEMLFSFESAPEGYIITDPTSSFQVQAGHQIVAEQATAVMQVNEINETGNETTEMQTEEEAQQLMDESGMTPSDYNNVEQMIDVSEEGDEHFIEHSAQKSTTKSDIGLVITDCRTVEDNRVRTQIKTETRCLTTESANIEKAVQVVLRDGCSLQKAANQHNISKTVLWRRVRLEPAYLSMTREKPSLTAAFERLRQGNSLKSISTELNIPMSTLHRHKVRLSLEGRLPENVASKRRDTIPRDQMREKLAKAVHACLYEGMTQNHAANLFEIPKSTLWRHMQRRQLNAEAVETKDEPEHYEELVGMEST